MEYDASLTYTEFYTYTSTSTSHFELGKNLR